MNEFRGNRPPLMTAEDLERKRSQRELNKVDPQADTDLEDRVGLTTDRELDEVLEVEGEDADMRIGGSEAIIGSRMHSRIMETPKTMERGFQRGDKHRGDEKVHKPARVKPPHRQEPNV